MDNTGKFTGKAASYTQGRRGYPEGLLDLLAKEGRREPLRAADAGSGTGILSRAMLERGWTVYGVEPNNDMREEAEKLLREFPLFHSVPGTAEHTLLPDASVDLVTAAQAFHWFDAAAFKRECRRILAPGGKTALIWNSRAEDSPAVLEEGRIHRLYCPRFYGFSGGLADIQGRIADFFDHHFQVFRFPNGLSYTREQYIRRMLSSSYSPGELEEGHAAWLEALNHLFDRFQMGGKLTIPHETVAYLG